jgi:hypothetical protein
MITVREIVRWLATTFGAAADLKYVVRSSPEAKSPNRRLKKLIQQLESKQQSGGDKR